MRKELRGYLVGEQPDLGGMMSVSFGHSSALNVVDAAKVIDKWPIVEYVNIEHLAPPPPGDLPPTTPDFTIHQDWQGPGYGLNIEPFWTDHSAVKPFVSLMLNTVLIQAMKI